MSAATSRGKNKISQNKLSGERAILEPDSSKGKSSGESLLTTLLAVSPPIFRAGSKELQEQKEHWNGDIKDIHF